MFPKYYPSLFQACRNITFLSFCQVTTYYITIIGLETFISSSLDFHFPLCLQLSHASSSHIQYRIYIRCRKVHQDFNRSSHAPNNYLSFDPQDLAGVLIYECWIHICFCWYRSKAILILKH